MSNPFYNKTGNPQSQARGLSSQIRAEFTSIEQGFDLVAPINSPAFTGLPTAPSPTPGDSSTKLATTQFVMDAALSSELPGQTGNAGKFLGTDGTSATWGAVPIKTLNGVSLAGTGDIDSVDVQEFTASGTWTKPANCTMVLVELWAGGGGGGRRTDATVLYTGAAGGEYTAKIYKASSLGSTVPIVIGLGGAKLTSGNSPGNDGGNTTFDTQVAYGGRGALNVVAYTLSKRSSLGFTTTDLLNIPLSNFGCGGRPSGGGQAGGNCFAGGGGGGAYAGTSGAGGISENGGSGGYGSSAADAGDGAFPSGGGGSVINAGASTYASGKGGDGFCRVTTW